MKNNYAAIAHEYYDKNAHPTCADLGYASEFLLRNELKILISPDDIICELGAGRSALLDAANDFNWKNEIIATDRSQEMLEHSQSFHFGRARFLICDARDLPLESSSVDIIVSLLGDPYNSEGVWNEVHRVLKTNGRVFFTTPSWEWASTFRGADPHERSNSALFVTKSGVTFYVPSNILTETEQCKLMAAAGLQVQSIFHFSLAELKRARGLASPKLADYLSDESPIVTGFLAVKTD